MIIRLGFLIAVLSALLAPWPFAAPSASAATQWIGVGASHKMRAYLATPDGPGPFPAVLVLHISGGMQSADREFADRLAGAGYVALAPAFLEAYAISPQQRRLAFTADAQPLFDDFVAALETLRHTPKVDGAHLAALGFSNGGYFALWLAAKGKVRAGIAYYGNLTGAGTDKPMQRFQEAFSRASSPVLVLHGDADTTAPVGTAYRLIEILRTAKAPYEAKIFPGAGHRFERDRTSAADRAAAEEAWPLTLAFLRRYLG